MRGDPFRRFLFRLAATLGKSLRELLDSMDSHELSEWIAYDRVEPLPESWQETGLLAALLHNAWSKGRPRRPEDFIPSVKRHVETSPEAAVAIFRGIAAALQRRDPTGNGDGRMNGKHGD